MNPLHFLFLLSIILIWGVNFVMIKVSLQELSPWLLCCLRFFLSSVPAVFFVPFPKTSIKMVAFYGLTTFAVQFTLLFMGMQTGMSAGLTSLLLQSQVFFTILLAILFLGEKLHRWHVFGALLSFSGIAFIGIHLSGVISFSGLALILCAAFCWGSGSIISKKTGSIDALGLVVWGSLFAWPPLLALSMAIDGPHEIFTTLLNLSWPSIGASLYTAYLATLFAFGGWNWLLRYYPLFTITPFSLLVPIVGMASSALVFQEPLYPWKIYAGFLVISGLCVNVFGPRLMPKKGLLQ